MSADFHLIDLVSQAGAIRKRLHDKTNAETLHWLAEHGEVEVLPNEFPGQKQCYLFTSRLGQKVIFFFGTGGLVFVGDNTTFTRGDE